MLYITINRGLAAVVLAVAVLAGLLLGAVSLARGAPNEVWPMGRGDTLGDIPLRSPALAPTAQGASPASAAQALSSGWRISLPALDTVDCETWIQVQNVGHDFTKAILVLWGEWGPCIPTPAGPLKAECSGLIPPGGAWAWIGHQLPYGARSGIVYSVGAQKVAALADIFADILCEAISETVLGDSQDWLTFDQAFTTGGVWSSHKGDLDFGTNPGQPLAVTVKRKCPADNTPSTSVNAGYPGLPEAMQGVYDPDAGGYVYYASPVWASFGTAPDDMNTTIHVQNLGDECASIELWFQSRDNCLSADIGEIVALAPGETFPFDPNTVVGPDFVGTARIIASEPLGVVLDHVGRDLFMSHAHDPGGQVYYAPLFFREYQGWDIDVHVPNWSSTVNARVTVTFLDAAGQAIVSYTDWVCPRGLQTFQLPMADVEPGYEIGAIRIESEDWWSPGDPGGEVPIITPVVMLTKYQDLTHTLALEALSYNALPAHQVEGTEVIALPMVAQNKQGVTSEIALANLNPGAGATDVRITLYDQVGVLTSFTRQLKGGQVEYLDVNDLRHVNPGFLGSAVISVMGTTQDSVALAAAGVQRFGRVLTDPDIPGDEILAVAGRPLPAPFAPYPLERCSVVDRPVPDSTTGLRVGLPALDTEDCETWILTQNVGDDFTQAVLVIWADPGPCEPQATGPWEILCTGLISPGTTWTWSTGVLPAWATSAVLYSLSAELISGDDTFADLVCQALNETGVGDDDDWRRFDLAYVEGGVWTSHRGVHDFGANPGQPIAVTVNRACPGNNTAEVNVNATYRGIAGVTEGTCNTLSAGYTYYAPLVWASFGIPPYNWNSTIHIQNLGDECTSIEVWFQAQDNCLRATIGEILALAPGEAWSFNPNWVIGPDWQGTAWIRASQPLGVVVDQIGQDLFMSYNGTPADAPAAAFTAGSTVNHVPLVYPYRYGWDTGLQVQNLSPDENALVRVTFSDGEGRIITTITDWICPYGTQTFFLPAINWPGDLFEVVSGARIESEAWRSPGDADVHRPNVATLVTAVKYQDSTRAVSLEGLSYGALPAQEVEGVGQIALPLVARRGNRTTTEIGLANLNPVTGTTTVHIDLYDQIGFIDSVSRTLNSGQLEYIDVDAEAAINPGFIGSAVISATGGTQGGFALAAVGVERAGRTLSEPDIPGDEVRAYEGQALGILAGSAPTISQVRVTNARDTSFTVSWVTDQEASGEVHYGTDPDHLNDTAYDDRGVDTTDDTHHVTLTGLTPNTTYYFDVVSDGATDDNDGAHYTATTGPTLSLPPSDTIYGQVFKEDGTTPAEGAIVYIRLRNLNGNCSSPDEAAPLSVLVDHTGYWYANLGNVRIGDLSGYFDYSASGDELWLHAQGAADGEGCQIVDTADDTPAADIVLNVSTCPIVAEIPLQIGWNHVSLPVRPLRPYTAECACDEIIDQGGDVAEIDRWYASGWDGHICGMPFNDFLIELGSDYFVKSNTASTWTIEGYPVTTTVPIDLQIGWNSIGIPYSDGYTAESLCQEIIDQGVTAVEIDRWYASGWDGHICGLPFNDFAIEIGKGYFVKAGSSGTVTPTALASWSSEPESTPAVLSAVGSKAVPATEVAVRDLQVSNLRDTSVTLSWITDEPTTGYVLVGETQGLDHVAYDARGADVTDDTHYVVLTGLAPEMTYHFDIVSGAGVDDNGGSHYTVTTGPALDSLPASDTVYGQVFRADEETPAAGTIVYLTLMDNDGLGSAGQALLLSALVDADGYWHTNLGNARLAGGVSNGVWPGYFVYSMAGDRVALVAQGAADGIANRTVDTGDLRPAAPLILGRQTRLYLPLIRR